MHDDLDAAAHDLVAVHSVLAPHPTMPYMDSFIYRGAWHGGTVLQMEPVIRDVPLDERSARVRAQAGTLRKIVDGLSKTALLVEQAGKPVGLGADPNAAGHPPSEGAWATCDYGSFYGSGVNFHNFRDPFGFHRGAMVAMADGAVAVLPEGIPREIMVALFSRDGGEIMNAGEWQ